MVNKNPLPITSIIFFIISLSLALLSDTVIGGIVGWDDGIYIG